MRSKWLDITLGDFLTLQRGFDLPKKDRIEGPYPVIASTGPVGTHNHTMVSGPGVVIGRSGSLGGGQYIRKDFWPLNTTLWVKDFKENLPLFCYYLIKSIDFTQFNVGSGVPTLNRNHIHPLPIHVPPLPEQRAIAHILGSLDDKIELNQRMNKTLEAMARAIFKSWFVDFDPVRAPRGDPVWSPTKGADTKVCPYMTPEILNLFPDSFQDSDLGEIPKGWKSRSLYDSAKYVNGAAYRNFHFTNEENALPVVKIAELKNGVTGQTKFTKIELDEKYRIADGEILLSWSGNPDTSIDTFVWSGGAAWLNQHIFRVLSHQENEKHFVFYLLKYLRPVFAEIARNKQTTGLGHFTAQDMKWLMVVLPPEELLAKFNDLVGPIFNRWYGNLFESNSLASLRDTLIPKLISGELRVPDAEKLVEGAV